MRSVGAARSSHRDSNIARPRFHTMQRIPDLWYHHNDPPPPLPPRNQCQIPGRNASPSGVPSSTSGSLLPPFSTASTRSRPVTDAPILRESWSSSLAKSRVDATRSSMISIPPPSSWYSSNASASARPARGYSRHESQSPSPETNRFLLRTSSSNAQYAPASVHHIPSSRRPHQADAIVFPAETFLGGVPETTATMHPVITYVDSSKSTDKRTAWGSVHHSHRDACSDSRSSRTTTSRPDPPQYQTQPSNQRGEEVINVADRQKAKKQRKRRYCQHEGCPNYVIDHGLCISHGGGKRCYIEDCGCRAQRYGLCWKHGGYKMCTAEGCKKRAKSRGFCWFHGGGTKCKFEGGCDTVAVSRGLCWAHGGGKRCEVANCQKPASQKYQNLCASHFKERNVLI